MSQDGSTARIDAYLQALRRLKESSARRDAMEREILYAVLKANASRLAETPSGEEDQKHLAQAIADRAELLPAHEHFRDWMTQYLATLNQYEVAERTGSKQTGELLPSLLNQEAVLAKCVQGYVVISGVMRDEFNDVILRRFGESALADIDELTHAGFSDDHYWKALLDRFAIGFVNKAFSGVLSRERFKLTREGNFVAVRFPLDAILEQMPGTGKEIEKTRLQAAFDAAREGETQKRAIQAVASLAAGLAKPMLPPGSARHVYELLGQAAAMDPEAVRFVEVFVDGRPMEDPAAAGGEDPKDRAERLEAAMAFVKEQVLATAAGAAMAHGILMEDFGRALGCFAAREQERLLAVISTLDPAGLALAHTLMVEFALCGLLMDKLASEGGKTQVKCVKQRRVSRADLEILAAKGFNRVRQKLYFDEDPASPEWMLFRAKTLQELGEAMALSNLTPNLAQALTVLWNRMEFKVEAVALINLALVARTTQNVQGKLGEILSKLGVFKASQPKEEETPPA
jgi:hypothetical protein